ncbi:hypothetical protein Taro_028059 [Colocasia esculenta]|uniref:Uncharacterized protein n=1 Tax=Colocasia esculenta TaxID=4460 RepID=A0A843VAA5_COLES|nr:hypothetical protein [Colocasia esculenta]
MTDTHPPQSTVGTYRRQRRHKGSTSTLPQQSQSDLLGETLGSISEDIDSETAQSGSCDAILVHDTQSQSEIEVDAQEQCHSRGRDRVGNDIVDSKAGIVNADVGVGISNASFRAGNTNTDFKAGIGIVGSKAGIVNADLILPPGFPVTKLPTWQLGNYFGK